MYISYLDVSNFRSLKKVKIENLKNVTIFHGLNNSGKSNILSFMEIVLKPKTVLTDAISNPQLNIWRGNIANFNDNFYKNLNKDITFELRIVFDKNELKKYKDLLGQLSIYLTKDNYAKFVCLKGSIKHVDDSNAYMYMHEVSLNNKFTILNIKDNGDIELIPKLNNLRNDEKLVFFEDLMNLLKDSFKVVSSNRYLTSEVFTGDEKVLLSPNSFKQWLFNISVSRDQYENFQKIKTIFNSEPFKYGEISFVRSSTMLEIMVEKDGKRLPINRVGSGLQQVLYLISHIVCSKGKMLGIEELEINLSPIAQKQIFEKIKAYIKQEQNLIDQIIITSHSPYFGHRTDVRCYEVENDGDKTVVNNWKKSSDRLFKI